MSSRPLTMIRYIVFTCLFVGFTSQFSYAALVNGDFTSGSTGWTLSDPTFLSFTGGQAVISESIFDFEVLFSQQFFLPTNSTILSFDILALTTEADAGFLPDAFNASLLDPNTLLPLVPTADVSTDAFYTRDLVDGVVQGIPATGVTFSPAATSLPLTVVLDVSSLSSQDVLLQFKLVGGGADFLSSVTLDNVRITAVPEPSCWLLLATALGIWTAKRRRTLSVVG